MALSSTLNFYSYTQLNTYAHTTLAGTVYFSVLASLTGSRDSLGLVSGVNTCQATFNATSSIDAWEIRATLSSAPSGVGIGLLMGNGGAVPANTNTVLAITSGMLTFGDGNYRISVYVRKDNIWYGG